MQYHNGAVPGAGCLHPPLWNTSASMPPVTIVSTHLNILHLWSVLLSQNKNCHHSKRYFFCLALWWLADMHSIIAHLDIHSIACIMKEQRLNARWKEPHLRYESHARNEQRDRCRRRLCEVVERQWKRSAASHTTFITELSCRNEYALKNVPNERITACISQQNFTLKHATARVRTSCHAHPTSESFVSGLDILLHLHNDPAGGASSRSNEHVLIKYGTQK